MTQNKGFIILWRKMFDWEWYGDATMVGFFVHLLLRANHAPQKWKGQIIERGQFVTGRLSLAKETGLSQQTVRTLTTKLKSTNEITIKSTSKYSIFTIVKYGDYQKIKKNQPTNQPSIQPTTNQQLTTNNNINNENKYREGHFVPPSLEELSTYIQVNGYEVNPDQWLAFYESKGWLVGKAKMKSWKASVRTWAIKNKSSAQNTVPTKKPNSILYE